MSTQPLALRVPVASFCTRELEVRTHGDINIDLVLLINHDLWHEGQWPERRGTSPKFHKVITFIKTVPLLSLGLVGRFLETCHLFIAHNKTIWFSSQHMSCSLDACLLVLFFCVYVHMYVCILYFEDYCHTVVQTDLGLTVWAGLALSSQWSSSGRMSMCKDRRCVHLASLPLCAFWL